ncbi:MAG: RluA family pseudouridine synthase [Clostridiales bacterium]|jgi:23S rRNA pseudouridine1911/1915/1917 synthase|nr:RluA family pseudouridine synthase [Clostridiales bacterium]
MELRILKPLPEITGERLDRYVSDSLGVARAQVQGWLERGLIKTGGTVRAKNYRLRAGDIVEVAIPDPVICEAKPEPIELNVIYEDEDLLVVNKPKGMVVHPAAGNPDGTLVNALLAHCGDSLSGIGGVLRPGIVHRLDKDTSGLLIVAKNDTAHNALAAQIKAHSFTRIYEAVVVGSLKGDRGTVDAPIGRHPVHRKKMAVLSPEMLAAGRAKNAVTHYEVIARYTGYSHIRVRLETGRTHQIRVHMAYLGHPVAGDVVYGGGRQPAGLRGQCLHARTIGFAHPRDGRYIELTGDLPDYFTAFLKTLGDPE